MRCENDWFIARYYGEGEGLATGKKSLVKDMYTFTRDSQLGADLTPLYVQVLVAGTGGELHTPDV